ncbi:MAG: hypothetical protein KC931_01505 [Candidatus Omnitrophica bacterium]|nr:hypothetical protein [Candidatus Omnitrophota bacterium]
MKITIFNGKKTHAREGFTGRRAWVGVVVLALFLSSGVARAWTVQDYNPWKQLREHRIFSLTRANPIGSRILVIPVLDDPINTPVYTRVCSEFTNQLRSFASEVWLITDLPYGPVKQGFYSGLSRILADYRLKNQLSMGLITTLAPDFECDFIALFEVTSYDRYWIDHDLQYRVGLRCVLYDYLDGGPRVEKYYQGGRGRRLEEGAFSEAERIAVKGLVGELERPLRRAVEEREKELERRYQEIGQLAALTNQKEYAIHDYDLGVLEGRAAAARDKAMMAEQSKSKMQQELEYWKQQAEANKQMAEEYRGKAEAVQTSPGGSRKNLPFYPTPAFSRFRFPCPPGATQIQIPKKNVTEEKPPLPPREEPPRMPTLQPIDLRGSAPNPPRDKDSAASQIVAFESFHAAPKAKNPGDARNDSVFSDPPWERQPSGDWEYVGQEP